MTKEELYDLLEIDTPADLEYFEQMADLLETEEEISRDLFRHALSEIRAENTILLHCVNEQGKTHEATKHTKDPLSPGQSAPKNEKQQKEQNAEEQKPKRKTRSVKM